MKQRKGKTEKKNIAISIFLLVLTITMPIVFTALQPEIEGNEIKQNSSIDFFSNIIKKTILFFKIFDTITYASAEELPDYGCCKGVLGDACKMTSAASCSSMPGNPAWLQGKLCNQNSRDNFCQQICCYSEKERHCESNVNRWVCLAKGLTEVGLTCEDVPICKKGCCTHVSGLTDYTTEQDCSSIENTTWDATMSEYECSIKGSVYNEGCCVFGGSCTWMKESECPVLGNFRKDVFCSSPTLSQFCNCKPTSKTGCYENKLDVYKFDSCGNPDGIAKTCDYLGKGERCVQTSTGAECKKDICEVKLPNGTEYKGNNALKSGESICVYDQELPNIMDDPALTSGKTLGNFSLDAVGSRHWRWLCANGQLHVEACGDYRQQICIDGSVQVEYEGKEGTFREATCVGNAYKDCFTKKTEQDCINAMHGQCYWFADIPEVNKTINTLKQNGLNLGVIEVPDYMKLPDFDIDNFHGFLAKEDGEDTYYPRCLPKYSPGYDQENYAPLCMLGTGAWTVNETRGGLVGEWTCQNNCEVGAFAVDGWPIRENSWTELMARRCSALGDCGLKVNLVGKTQSATLKTSSIQDILKSPGMIALRYFPGACKNDEYWDEEGQNGTCKEFSEDAKVVSLLNLYSGIFSNSIEERDLNAIEKEGNLKESDYGILRLVRYINDNTKVYSLEGKNNGQTNLFTGGAIVDVFSSIIGFITILAIVSAGYAVAGGAYNSAMNPFNVQLSQQVATTLLGQTPVPAAGETIVVPTAPATGGIGVWASFGGALLAAAIGVAVGLIFSYALHKVFGVNQRGAQWTGLFAGTGTSLLVSTLLFHLTFGFVLGAGIVAALALFLIYQFASKEKQVLVYEFQCLPYQAPDGGQDCTKCNEDPSRPCSKYRCSSLGAACNFTCEGEVNQAGVCSEGSCFWQNPGDMTSPKISSIEPITSNIKINEFRSGPPGGGASITDKDGNCISPFESISLNFKTNEKAQCKYDYLATTDYESMRWYAGPVLNPTKHDISHILSLKLTQLTPEFTVQVRCKDLNGNKNLGEEFKIRFCSSITDFSVPGIDWFDPESESKIDKTKTQVSISFATSEPVSGCKEDPASGVLYDNMINTASCSPSLGVSRCNITLPFDGAKTNNYNFKCKDLSGNANTEDTFYVLYPGEQLNITEFSPNETIAGCKENIPTEVDLTLTTGDGCCDGLSECSYKKDNEYIRFAETGYNIHKQKFVFPAGITNPEYYIVCIDADGNIADKTISFKISPDESKPNIIRFYKEGSELVIQTSDKATCVYNKNSGCDFDVTHWRNAVKLSSSDRLTHSTAWQDKPWSIKCYDECNNGIQNNECVTIIPSSLE